MKNRHDRAFTGGQKIGIMSSAEALVLYGWKGEDMTDYYDPGYLRGVIRKTMPLKQFFRQRFFPEDVLFGTDTVTFEYQAQERKLAPYTTMQFGGVPADREGWEVGTYRPPLLLPMGVITNDTIAQKLLGESPWNSGITPDERAATIAAQDLMRLQDRIQRREEHMCARVLQDGKLSVTGPGVNDVVDYHFTGIETATSADKWTSGYDVIGKLSHESQNLRKSGSNPDTLVLGTDAANALLGNSKVMKLMDCRAVDMGEIRPSELEGGVQYLGRLAVPGLFCDMYSYDEWYVDDSGVNQPMLDPGTAILISSRARNSMLYGAVTYVDANTGEYVTEMGRYVPYTNWSVNPPVREIYLASRPLPMPKDLESWHVMKEVA